MVALFSIPGNFFPPFFADRTPIISQTNTKQHPLKHQNKSPETWYNNWSWVSIVGSSQESLIARGDSWTKEAFARRPLAKCISWWSMRFRLNNCHHLTLPISPEDLADGETATDWWLNHSLNHSAALFCYTVHIWVSLFDLLLSNCHTDSDIPRTVCCVPVMFGKTKEGNREQWFWLGSTFLFECKNLLKTPRPKVKFPLWITHSHLETRVRLTAAVIKDLVPL